MVLKVCGGLEVGADVLVQEVSSRVVVLYYLRWHWTIEAKSFSTSGHDSGRHIKRLFLQRSPSICRMTEPRGTSSLAGKSAKSFAASFPRDRAQWAGRYGGVQHHMLSLNFFHPWQGHVVNKQSLGKAIVESLSLSVPFVVLSH